MSVSCVKCPRPAIVHLTEVLGENPDGGKQILQIDLCMDHAIEGGVAKLCSAPFPPGEAVSMAQQLPWLALTGGAGEAAIVSAQELLADDAGDGAESPAVCPNCSMTWKDFLAHGFFGCPNDYVVFLPRLVHILKLAQEGQVEHVGKIPLRAADKAIARRAEIARLQRRLDHAIQKENYEDAAGIKDQLRRIQEPTPPP